MADITIAQGATFQIALNFNQPEQADGSPGDPIDVSAWSFEGQIRANYSSPVALQSFTFSEGIATNQVLVSLTVEQADGLPVRPTQNYQITPTNYAYDIFATRPDTVALKILQGAVNVIPRVTQ